MPTITTYLAAGPPQERVSWELTAPFLREGENPRYSCCRAALGKEPFGNNDGTFQRWMRNKWREFRAIEEHKQYYRTVKEHELFDKWLVAETMKVVDHDRMPCPACKELAGRLCVDGCYLCDECEREFH